MHRSLVCFIIVIFVTSPLCFSGVAKANLISNGNFSTGTLAGWEAIYDSNVVATDYASMPQNYKNTWDLSSWNAFLDGSFALFVDHPAYLQTIISTESGLMIPTSLSLDYAVAWADPKFGNYPYGYFYVQTFGVVADKQLHMLSYKEIDWYVSDPTIVKGVFTGTLYVDNIIHRPEDLVFKEILLGISVFSPSDSLQIVGIDNVKLSVPTPEPSTLILLGIGLAGLAGIMRNMKRS